MVTILASFSAVNSRFSEGDSSPEVLDYKINQEFQSNTISCDTFIIVVVYSYQGEVGVLYDPPDSEYRRESRNKNALS
jgi:hypothetical protein